ncbi:MAG: hypothetical protein E6K54_08965 [Gammaproteobacteria bacterium]|nr:MAG: hypothetical protein E6K54_08965 [Gammaproteobacteria bacterium]
MSDTGEPQDFEEPMQDSIIMGNFSPLQEPAWDLDLSEPTQESDALPHPLIPEPALALVCPQEPIPGPSQNIDISSIPLPSCKRISKIQRLAKSVPYHLITSYVTHVGVEVILKAFDQYFKLVLPGNLPIPPNRSNCYLLRDPVTNKTNWHSS